MLLASCIAQRMWLCKQFFTSGKMTTFQTLKNKIDKLTNMIDFDDFPPFFLRKSVFCYFHLHEENKSGSSVTKLRCRMFTEKNLSGDGSRSPLDALVLHLRRVLIFFLNTFTSLIKIIKHNIEKTFSMHKIPLFT